MNLLKTLTVGLLVAAMPNMASAVTTIRITGSTAFRTPTMVSMIGYCLNNGNHHCYAAYAGTTPSGTNGTLYGSSAGIMADGTLGAGGTATIAFEMNWTGSLAGVIDVATQNPILFPDSTNAGNQANVNLGGPILATNATQPAAPLGAAATQSAPAAFATDLTAPDVCMTDAFVSSAASALSGVQISNPPLAGANNAAQLVAIINAAGMQEAGSAAPIIGAGTAAGYLGIVPFQWCIGNLQTNAPNASPVLATAPTNITMQSANFLIKAGYVPLSMLSKVPTDSFSSSDFAYLIGRNEDSGTRIDEFAEPQLGFITNPKQWLLSFSGYTNLSDVPYPTDCGPAPYGKGGASSLVEGAITWPANATLNTEPKCNWAAAGGGHGGYPGGGDVSSVLSTPVDESNIVFPAAPGENLGNIFFIGYLGIADSGSFGNATKIHNGQALTYNGVVASTSGCQNGSYSCWSYEHMYYLPAFGNKAVMDNIANSIAQTYADYDSTGNAAPNTDAAGVFILPNAGAAATAAGDVKRSVEGGGYTLNY